MKTTLIARLICPQCEEGLDVAQKSPSSDPDYGILECGCSEYPIVAGIPVLRFGPDHDEQRIEAGELIKEGKTEEALRVMAIDSRDRPDLMSRNLRRLRRIPGGRLLGGALHRWQRRRASDKLFGQLREGPRAHSAREVFEAYFPLNILRAQNACDYFYYRFGQPRHLAFLSLASVLRESQKGVLDLACGFGHFCFSLTASRRDPVVGLDNDFFLLYVAKNWICPDAEFVHADADKTLPFKTEEFSAVICSNSFHFFDDKATSAAEMLRVLDERGVAILQSLRHALVPHETKNSALTPDVYRELFEGWETRTIVESDLVQRYLRREGPPLDVDSTKDRIENAPLINIVASRDPEVLRNHGRFEQWPHGRGDLQLNPLFRESSDAESAEVVLERKKPSEFFERENSELSHYLPDRVRCSREDLETLEVGERSNGVSKLIDQFAVLGIPKGYS